MKLENLLHYRRGKFFFSKSVFITVFIISLQLNCFAIVKIAVGTGNWTNGAIWSPIGVPTPFDNIIITTGSTIHYDMNVLVENGGSITIDGVLCGQDSFNIACGGTFYCHGQMSGVYIHVTDGAVTGTGVIYAEDTFYYTPCSGGFNIAGNIIIGQPYSCNLTEVHEMNSSADIFYYPETNLSDGIFKLFSSQMNLSQLCITDCRGRMVLASTNNFSEINLSNFSSGIYFYAITDEKENVFRGRIVKE